LNRWGIAVSVAILFLLLIPTKSFIQDSPIFEFDKVVHLVIFAGLTAVSFQGLNRWFEQEQLTLNPVRVATLYAMSFGVLIEFLQDWLPTGRSFEFFDIVADATGALIMYVLLQNRFRSNTSK